MTEAKYREFLRAKSQDVHRMLSGVVKTTGVPGVRVDPPRVQDLFRRSVRSFVAWYKQHHRAENKIAETDLEGAEPIEKPNPIDWPTPEGRKAFAGDRQLVCCIATLCAIHDANKNPCVDVRGWPPVRVIFYRLIRDGARSALKDDKDEPPVYDRSVIEEAWERVVEHLAHDVGQSPQAEAPAGGRTAKDRFTFRPGQALFDGTDLGLPAGLPIPVLEMLVKNFGAVVAYETLDGISGKTAEDGLRTAKSDIRKALTKHRIPCEIVTRRREGYFLRKKNARRRTGV